MQSLDQKFLFGVLYPVCVAVPIIGYLERFLPYTCRIDYDRLCEKTILYVYIFVLFFFWFTSDHMETSPLTLKGRQIQTYAHHLMRFEQGVIFVVPQLFVKRDPLFSSPKPKPQVSFSDQNLSVVSRCRRRCRRWRCRKLFTFSSFFPEPLGQFHPNLAQSISGWRGFKFVQMKAPAFSKGRLLRNSENTLTKFKTLLLQNQWANFNHTWHNASLG